MTSLSRIQLSQQQYSALQPQSAANNLSQLRSRKQIRCGGSSFSFTYFCQRTCIFQYNCTSAQGDARSSAYRSVYSFTSYPSAPAGG